MARSEKWEGYLARRAKMLTTLVVERASLGKRKNLKPKGHSKHPEADPDVVENWEEAAEPATEAEAKAVKEINKGWAGNGWGRLNGRPTPGGLPSLGKRR